MTGVELIAAERAAHEAKGWTAAHDDTHDRQELARVAAALACSETGAWLENWSDGEWMEALVDATADDRIHQLVVTGALIAAEIDRLQRREGER